MMPGAEKMRIDLEALRVAITRLPDVGARVDLLEQTLSILERFQAVTIYATALGIERRLVGLIDHTLGCQPCAELLISVASEAVKPGFIEDLQATADRHKEALH